MSKKNRRHERIRKIIKYKEKIDTLPDKYQEIYEKIDPKDDKKDNEKTS